MLIQGSLRDNWRRPEEHQALSRAIHRLVLSLPEFDASVSGRDLPKDGIYFFFEAGERDVEDGTRRIVRVGTHLVEGRLPKRIRQHYGPLRGGSGNRNSSVFRLLVGKALLRRVDATDRELDDWLDASEASPPRVELQVTRYFQENFTFRCIPVRSRERRMTLERKLIATLAAYRVNAPSLEWLGRWTGKPEIVSSGLWNVQHVGLPDRLMTTDLEFLASQAESFESLSEVST